MRCNKRSKAFSHFLCATAEPSFTIREVCTRTKGCEWQILKKKPELIQRHIFIPEWSNCLFRIHINFKRLPLLAKNRHSHLKSLLDVKQFAHGEKKMTLDVIYPMRKFVFRAIRHSPAISVVLTNRRPPRIISRNRSSDKIAPPPAPPPSPSFRRRRGVSRFCLAWRWNWWSRIPRASDAGISL